MSPSLLDAALRPGALRARFQPVVDLLLPEAPVHYLEGLVRGPEGTNIEHPEVLFGYARRKCAERVVDRASLRTVLATAPVVQGVSIGVNVHMSTLSTDLGFLDFLGDVLVETGIAPESLVLELVEQGEVWDLHTLLLNLDGLRSIGLRIALDDFGTGHANYMLLLECRPDYLKIDRYFVHGCHLDDRRRAFLDSLVMLAGRVGARVVAEGIEDREDLACVVSAGIVLAQGYLLGRPGPLRSYLPRSTRGSETYTPVTPL